MNEALRLATLQRYGILDTPPEAAFDAIAQEAARELRCRFAAVSFIDGDRQWLKARINLDLLCTTRDGSFCTHAIEQDEVMVVPDARLDPVFAGKMTVLAHPYIRFYAAAPIKALNRTRLGTICVFDSAPRQDLSARDRRFLSAMAARVVELLERRRWAPPSPVSSPSPAARH